MFKYIYQTDPGCHRKLKERWSMEEKRGKKGKEKFIHYKVKYKCIKLELSTSWVELGLGSTHHLT